MPKDQYFLMRYTEAVAAGMADKARYYSGRLSQMGVAVPDAPAAPEEDSYRDIGPDHALHYDVGSVGRFKALYPATGPISEEHRLAFIRLTSELSPENLCCDGELTAAQVRVKKSRRMAEWHRLEKLAGRKVSENEVYTWMI
jgi:hypothetical protein